MNKRIKTTSIIFNVLCLVGTILNFVIAFDAINIKHAEDLSSLGLIALLPIFLIVLFCMFVFAIVQLALFLKAKHIAKENQASLLLYEKIFRNFTTCFNDNNSNFIWVYNTYPKTTFWLFFLLYKEY